MADFKMTDYETPDKYVYDTIEELIATENKGLVLKKKFLAIDVLW